MSRSVTNDDIGIKILREPRVADGGLPDGTQLIDILAVHGIGAHPDATWTSKIDPSDESKGYINWLKDDGMLPEAVPNARIMRYGYQSAWFGKDAIRTQITTVAQRMLLALQGDREDDPSRPLIFVAHCYGGLLVLQALLTAFRYQEEYTGIADATVGIVFLGTPFRGAVGLSQSEMIQAALREYSPEEIQADTFQILQPGNEFLQHLLDEFGKTVLSHPARPSIACFYEIEVSDVGRVVGKEKRVTYVVDESSGCLDVGPKTKKYSMWRNHFSINKFRRARDEDYLTVRRVIRDMVRNSCSFTPAKSPGTYLRSQRLEGSTSLLRIITNNEKGESRTIEPLVSRTAFSPISRSITEDSTLDGSGYVDSPKLLGYKLQDFQTAGISSDQESRSQSPFQETSLEWLSVYEWLKVENSDAVRLIELWAFLDRHGVEYDILQPSKHGKSRLLELPSISGFWPEWVVSLCNREVFSKAVRLLWHYSFIYYDSSREQFSIREELHEHLFAILKARGTHEVTTYWWLAAHILGMNVPRDIYQSNYIQLNRWLVPHVFQLHRRMRHCHSDLGNQYFPGVDASAYHTRALLDLSKVLNFMYKLKEAEDFLSHGLLLHSFFSGSRVDSQSYSIQAEMNLDLARTYRRQGKWSMAERICWTMLQSQGIRKTKDQSLRATIILAGLMKDSGKTEMGEEMLEREYSSLYGSSTKPLSTINIRDEAQLDALDLLTWLRIRIPGKWSREDYMKVVAHQRSFVNKVELSLGANHLLTLGTFETLADILVDCGEYEEAYAIKRSTMAKRERLLGKDHPELLVIIHGVGQILRLQEKYFEAESMFKEALKGYEKAGMHRSVQRVSLRLIRIYDIQGRHKEAEELCIEIIEISNRNPDLDDECRRQGERQLQKIRMFNNK